MTAAAADAAIERWRSRGDFLETPDGSIFVIDAGSTDEPVAPPLLVLHGFPTSSFDFSPVLDDLRRERRVILFDQLGFGLSDKPDRRYGIHLHADTAEHVIEAFGLTTFDLLTHDMGDSVGGELLARDLAGDLDGAVRKRVLTNGSIYLDLAQLTTGQQLLMGLPDAPTEELPVENFLNGVTNTFAPASIVDPVEALAQGLLARHNGGLRLMARLIRYLEDRQREEARFTGAIEAHPSPLHIVWGDLDPVAVIAMASRLQESLSFDDHAAMLDAAAPDDAAVADDAGSRDSAVEILHGVGHYPMVEAPERFAAAVLRGLT